MMTILFCLISYICWRVFGLHRYPQPMMIWPAEALVLVYGLVRGWSSIPGNFLGIVIVKQVLWQIGWPAAIGIALFNSLAPAIAGIWTRRYTSHFPPLNTLRNTGYFILFGIILMPLLTSSGSGLTLWASHRIPSFQLWPFSRQWYLNDMCGNLIYAPLWLAWIKPGPVLSRKTFLKLGLISFITILIAYGVVSSGKIPIQGMAFILIIPLTWITIRYSLRESMTLFMIIIIMLLIMIPSGYTGQALESASRLSIAFMAVSINLTLLMLNALAVEQKTSQETISIQKKEYAHYLDNLPGIAYRCRNDHDRTILHLSRGFEKITGYSIDQQRNNLALFFNQLILPEYRDFSRKKFHELGPNRPIIEQEYPIRRYDGEIRWLWERSHFIAGDSALNSSIEGYIEDITQRKRIENDLQESEEKFRGLFENIVEGMAVHELVYDQQGQIVNYRIIDVNPTFEIHTGLSADSVKGKLATEAYQTSTAPYLKEYGRVVVTGVPLRFETYNQPMGKYFSISAVSLLNRRFATVFEDITERHNQEKELHQRNEELTRFIYSVSHDLKSPLVTIKAFSGYLKEDYEKQDSPAISKDIGYIQHAADKMGRLLDELLELSRVGRKENPYQEVSLTSIAQNAIDLVAGRIKENQTEILLDPTPVYLYGDPPRLIQLYQNLIDNAVKFMGQQPHPQVEIGHQIVDQQIILFVRDNGCGIDPRYHHKLFGLFEKLDPKMDGTGIGLSLVKRIVDVHQGRIWVESTGKDQGTTFYFTLPHTKLANQPEIQS